MKADSKNRFYLLDAFRGMAMILMAIYHFIFDLNLLELIHINMKTDYFWLSFRNLIVISFLFLVGTSFILAKGQYSSKNFWMRILKIAGCAGLISLASYFQNPETWIFFGILHLIAFASLFSPYLILSPGGTLLGGLFLIALPEFAKSEFFFKPILVITGLSPYSTGSADFAPLAPWLGIICIGIYFGSPLEKSNFEILRKRIPFLSRIGQFALIFYMLHQIVLYTLAWCLRWLFI